MRRRIIVFRPSSLLSSIFLSVAQWFYNLISKLSPQSRSSCYLQCGYNMHSMVVRLYCVIRICPEHQKCKFMFILRVRESLRIQFRSEWLYNVRLWIILLYYTRVEKGEWSKRGHLLILYWLQPTVSKRCTEWNELCTRLQRAAENLAAGAELYLHQS